MSSLWLSKKKKAELIALCDSLGIPSDGYLKNEIELVLAGYLNSHADELSQVPPFEQYYDTLSSRSPAKAFSGNGFTVAEQMSTRPRRRTGRYVSRTSTSTNNSTEGEETSPEPPIQKAVTRRRSFRTARTPRTVVQEIRDEPTHIPLPPSPAVVADAIELRANAIKECANKVVEKVAIMERAANLRDKLSNVVSVYAVTLGYEATVLLFKLIPFAHKFTTPAIPALNISTQTFLLPDFFILLTPYFWGPFLTWLSTSILIPLTNAYFFNLTVTAAASIKKPVKKEATEHSEPRAYQADPLAFAVTKALVVYLVHYKGFDFMGLFGKGSLATIEGSVGREAQVIGAGIAGVAALWESVLRR